MFTQEASSSTVEATSCGLCPRKFDTHPLSRRLDLETVKKTWFLSRFSFTQKSKSLQLMYVRRAIFILLSNKMCHYKSHLSMNSIGTFNCNVYFTRYALLQRKNELWPTKNKDWVRIFNSENWFLVGYLLPAHPL